MMMDITKNHYQRNFDLGTLEDQFFITIVFLVSSDTAELRESGEIEMVCINNPRGEGRTALKRLRENPDDDNKSMLTQSHIKPNTCLMLIKNGRPCDIWMNSALHHPSM